MKKKRICHITTDHKGYDTRIFLKECVSLQVNGYEVYLVQKEFDDHERDGVHLVKFNNSGSFRGVFWFLNYKDAYQKAVELDCDVYHFHDPSFFYYAKKLRRKGKRVIYDCHESNYSSINADYAKKKGVIADLLMKRYDIYERYIAKMMNAVITVTPQMVEYMLRYNDTVIMLTNYPLLKGYTVFSDEKKTGQLVFAGGINPLWCHDKVVDAISEMENVEYVICGKTPSGYIDSLKTRRGGDKLVYRGMLSGDEVQRLLQESNVGISISEYRNNTFGKEGTMGNTKIFEEMQAGLPVVCTDFVIWKQLIDEYKCGICVNPQSVEEIRNAIAYLIDHPVEAKEMGKRGEAAIRDVLNWEKQERELLDLYERVLSDK